METKFNFTLVGLFVIVLGAGIILSTFWLSSLSDTQKYKYYLLYIKESVSGLSVQSSVKFSGVDVGFVSSISLDEKDSQQVRILLAIQEDVPIDESTRATLMAQGITGLYYVGLKNTKRAAPRLTVEAGNVYPVIKSEPSLLVQLDSALREITDNFKSITVDFNKLLDDKNQRAISNTLQHLETISGTLAENSKEIDQTLKDTTVMMGNLKVASKKFPELVDTATNTLKSVQTASVDIQAVASQLLPGAIKLMQELDNVSMSLGSVASDIEQNPAIILRGKAPRALGPGEKLQ